MVIGTEERSSARVSSVPPITEQAMLVAARVTLGEFAAHAVSEPTMIAPLPIAQSAPVPASARDVPVHARAPLANPFAMAAVARPTAMPVSPVRARADRAPAVAATSEIELPQSQAADALARAQLEAALR